jgi:hypothetical protein
MSYSRRQLYAFGEPLGDSVTRKEGGRIVYGGGGGTPAPASTQTQITELPEFARGYAKDTLAKAGALTDLSQNPYKPYEANRIAGFSPLQQQAQQQAANMQTSGATGFGTQLAGAAGLGALGAQYDPTQFQADQFGGDAAQRYMSPYMQNVVDIQQREAQRQGDIAGTQLASQATKSGAFGGGRQAIMQAEAARNLSQQKGDIQARGLQSSYEQAQAQFNADQARRMQAQQLAEQSKQYGAGYGMQGLQTALQGAGQLGTLGGQEFAQGMDINKLQSAYGGQQQALQQQGLTQAYQDFQNQQNYPYKQLGFMSDMIRGLPLGQQSTKQVYEAEPGLGSQLIGAGTAAYGLSKFMAEGGITGDANVSNILSKLSDAQLEQAKQSAMEREDINQVNMIVAEQQERAQTRSGISAAAPEQGGIASAASDEMMDRMLPTQASMARGGIVAFADGDLITDPQFGGSTVELGEDRPKPTRDQVNAIVQALRDNNQNVGLSTIMDIEAGRITAPSRAADVAEPVASPTGLGGTREAKRAPAVLPPDIGAGRERPAAATAGGAPAGGRDLMQVQEDIYSRMKKLDKGDPYAAQIDELGKLNIQQKEDEKKAILADQAKFATAYDERGKRLDTRKADIAKREDKNLGLAFFAGGMTAFSTPGSVAKAIGAGAKVGTEKFASGFEKIQTAKDLLDKAMDDLEDLRLNRSEMSAKEIRLANSNISAAKVKAKELTIAGLKEAGAKTDAKANAIVEATFKQMQSREASAAADRRVAAAGDKPSETERMMKDIGAIASGKASYAGKTGAEGVQLYKENRAAVSGVRYEGPKKAASYTPGDAQLVKGLADQVSLLAGSTDPKNVAKVKVLEDKIAAVDRKYAATRGGGKPSANDPLGLGLGDI